MASPIARRWRKRPGFWQDLCNFVYRLRRALERRPGNLTLNSPKVIEGVTAYKKMYDAGATPKGTDAATYRRMFWEGKLAMEIDNGGVAGIFNQQAPDLPLAAAPSPFPTRAQGLVLAPLTINSNTKHKAAAITFYKWVCSRRTRSSYRTFSARATSRPSSSVRPKIWPSDRGSRSMTTKRPTAFRSWFRARRLKTPEILQIVLEHVLKVLQGGADPKKTMDDAQKLALSRVPRK